MRPCRRLSRSPHSRTTTSGCCATARGAAVVDPGRRGAGAGLPRRAKGSTLAAILVTHHHGDHVGGVAALRGRACPCPVFGPARETHSRAARARSRDGDRVDAAGAAPARSPCSTSPDTRPATSRTSGQVGGRAGALLRRHAVRRRLRAAVRGHAGADVRRRSRGSRRCPPSHARLLRARVHAREPSLRARGRAAATRRSRRASARERRGASGASPPLPSTIADELATNPFLRAAQPEVRAAAERHAGRALADEVEVFADAARVEERLLARPPRRPAWPRPARVAGPPSRPRGACARSDRALAAVDAPPHRPLPSPHRRHPQPLTMIPTCHAPPPSPSCARRPRGVRLLPRPQARSRGSAGRRRAARRRRASRHPGERCDARDRRGAARQAPGAGVPGGRRGGSRAAAACPPTTSGSGSSRATRCPTSRVRWSRSGSVVRRRVPTTSRAWSTAAGATSITSSTRSTSAACRSTSRCCRWSRARSTRVAQSTAPRRRHLAVHSVDRQALRPRAELLGRLAARRASPRPTRRSTTCRSCYDDFDDWQLALAAYNWGEGNVARAHRDATASAGCPETYEALAMPDETRNYLPKLQAVKNIVRDPEKYGLVLADIPDAPYLRGGQDRPQDGHEARGRARRAARWTSSWRSIRSTTAR